MKFIDYLKARKIILKDKWNEVLFKFLPLMIIGSLILYFGKSSAIYHKILPALLFALIPIFVGVVGTLLLWIEERNIED